MIWKLWIPPSTTFVISTHERIKEMSLFGFWPWKHNPQFLSSPKAFPAVNSTSESPRQLLELRINLLWGEDLRDTDGWITGVQLSGRPYLAQFNMGSNLFQLQGSKAVTLCPGEAGGSQPHELQPKPSGTSGRLQGQGPRTPSGCVLRLKKSFHLGCLEPWN